jgi:hypothetical protein
MIGILIVIGGAVLIIVLTYANKFAWCICACQQEETVDGCLSSSRTTFH